MQPFPTRWVLVCGVAAAAIMAVSVSAQTYLSMLGHGHSFPRLFAWQFCSWLVWAGLAPFVLARGRRLACAPSGRRTRRCACVCAIGAATIVLHILATAQFTYWLQPYVPVQTYEFGDAVVNQSRALLVADVFAFTVLILVGYAGAVYEHARTLEVRESRLEADLARAQLDALRREIEPHFLFNTLNAIAALIRSRANDRALAMLLGLGDLMRESMDTSREHTTTLGAELGFAKRFIDLQRVRFMDRLTVHYDVPSECEPCPVPSFLLQPLVENAFRHGIAKRPGQCRLEVSAALDAQRLHIWIRNDGADLPDGFRLRERAGVGLRNTLARMQRLHADAATLDVEPGINGGAVVHIILPAPAAGQTRVRAAG